VLEVRETDEYSRWFEKLRDPRARAKILARIRRMTLGNFGDVCAVGEGVSELRIDYGPGYRIYVKQTEEVTVVLLVGGDKRQQSRDIEKAKDLARSL
jgi:putative addiction module killer protein